MIAREKISVELFFAAGCSRCAEARGSLRAAAESTGQAQWTETDVAKNPDRAVALGVVSTPAVAIDGKLVFASMPTAAELGKAIEAGTGNR